MDQGSSSTSSGLNFQRIVLIIAIIMLIVAMIFIGYALYKQSSNITWPPETPQCPDYWTTDASGNCTNPENITVCEYNGIPGTPSGPGAPAHSGTWPTCPPHTN